MSDLHPEDGEVKVTETDYAYFAAVVDLLGSLRQRPTSAGTVIPYVSIQSTTQPELITLLAEVTGTQPVEVSRSFSRHRCNEHCGEPHDHLDQIRSTSLRWQVTGVKATVLLAAVLPYLRVQREAALELIAVGLEAPHKPATIQKMVSLGWPLPEQWVA